MSASHTVALPSWKRFVVIAAMATCTLAALLLGSMQVWQWLLIELLGCASLAVIWSKQGHLPWSSVLWPMLAFGGLVVLQWQLHWSVVPSVTLTELTQLVGAAVFFYLGLAAFETSAARRFARSWAWVCCGLLALEALAQFFTSGGYIYWLRDARYGAPFGPFVNRDDYAGFIELLLPLAIVWVVGGSRRRSNVQVYLAFLVPAVALVSILVSGSRAGAAVASAECAFMGLWLWRGSSARAAGNWKGALAALSVLAGALALGWQPLLQRFAKLASGPENLRWQVLPVCWRIFRQHWLVGAGFGTFGWIYLRFQQFDSGLQWPYAHNEYAQVLAETGLLGAACVVTFLGLYAIRGWDSFQQRPRHAATRAAAFVGTVGFLAHSVLDFEFHIPANCYLFFLLAGMVCAARSSRRPPAQLADAAGASRMAGAPVEGKTPRNRIPSLSPRGRRQPQPRSS